MKKFKKLIYAGLALIIVAGAVLFSQMGTKADGETTTSTTTVSTTTSTTNATAVNTSTTTTTEDVDLDNGEEDIDWDSLPTKDVTLSDETLEITEAGTYVLTGTSTASVHINTEGNVRLILNGATIKSTTGAAIYVEQAENTVIELADGTENTIEDAASRSDETIDGAIYSKDDLIFTGTGTLNVTANFADAIVSKDDLKFVSGTYKVTSVDDGIRGKDSVYIAGGTFTIDAQGDGIKSTNDTDQTKGFVYIADGTITINSGDDGIHAEEKLIVDGGTIDIQSSVEGLEAALLTINDGKITIQASDDGINGSASTFSDPVVTINGGTIEITMADGDTDGIDSNGDIVVNGGMINITGNSTFDYDGTATYTGGTIITNGEQQDGIPENTMMGGGPMGGGH